MRSSVELKEQQYRARSVENIILNEHNCSRTMYLPTLASVLLFSLLVPSSHVAASQASDTFQQAIPTPEQAERHLLITAVRNQPNDSSDSYLQCVRLPEPFHDYPTAGVSLPLSTAANITMVVLPPESEEGWHRPPAPMWFFLLSGSARVVTPSTGDEVWIEPPKAAEASTERGRQAGRSTRYLGVNSRERVETQAVLALDVEGKGHLTFYPGEEETVALQVPLGQGWIEWVDNLEVVWEGPCYLT